jgi:hypothetical protein
MMLLLCKGSKESPLRPLFTLPAVAGLSFLLAGCHESTSGEQLKTQMKEMNLTQKATAQFAGTVTIDGKPPKDALKDGLFIMMYDPNKPPKEGATPLKAIVNRDTGRFVFTTYSQGDGVPEGNYIVHFVALKHTIFGKAPGFHEPDGLHNLYNDPDKNAQDPQFKLDITKPGKTDYLFDLKLEGKEPVSTPGEHAVTHFTA